MNTLFDKIWDAHVVTSVAGGPDQLYIDRHYCHEVTSPQAFNELCERKLKVFRPQKTVCSPDHNIPTLHQDQPIADPVSRNQVDTLARNAREFGLTYYGLGNEKNGIIHVIGPEYGLTLPGMTIVCGDSHTSTHGAFGAIAFGIGTSEVAMVLASQCILQPKPKTMRINIEGQLAPGVTAKDIALYIIARMTTGGATGYFVEYAGEAIRALSMEERMTVCNLSIEMGARGGLIAPDETTFAYVKEREFAPKGEAWDRALAYWKTLHSDADATFDREVTFQAADIAPRITYGTNPGMGIAIDEAIPTEESIDESGKLSFRQALRYMGFEAGEKLLGKKIDYVFLGSCTNGRIEDFRAFARLVKGHRKADHVTAWLVPGSQAVARQIKAEGLDRTLAEAGFEIRQPGCSACLAMNDDKVPAGKYAVSTSNRNFEGRQGPGARTILAGPLVAAAAAITGEITDPRKFL
ncbi:3-isopropylmalate dehydratase large subunit [uncultured Barnesiella sp.]|uniref:3-isopropylmalate dehydratase large subunit n=1 Tax=uncultured Barnesiella sp. TaxID=584861 RepID=UPI00262BF0E4|nr:3-isopropylmalate dehydratase large subunit [uncultured Barnesiella sp.]